MTPAMVPVFLLALCFGAAVSAFNEIGQNGIDLHSFRASFEKVGRMLGFPRLSGGSGELFSQDEMMDIIENDVSDEELDKVKYQDHCGHDLVRVAFSIREKWAIAMLDADGKPPPGILYGNLWWPGSYRECLAVQAPPDPIDNHEGFGGRYCTMSLVVEKENLPISIGLCVPDTCNTADFANITKMKLIKKNRTAWPKLSWLQNSTAKVNLTGISCQPKTSEYDTGAIVVLVILCTCIFLVIVGTSLTTIEATFPLRSLSHQKLSDSINTLSAEIYSEDATKNSTNEDSELIVDGSDSASLVSKPKGPGFMHRLGEFMQCFCIIKNGAKILDTSDKGGTELRCIHGIRFLSMAWVILGHTYGFTETFSPTGNLFDLFNVFDNFSFQAVMQGSYAVDSFFVMSGFLLTHLFLREMNARDGKVSWIAFYLHRYWRLTPVYAMLIAFDTTLAQYLFTGPFRPTVEDPGCKKTWWWNLLYINNFAPLDESCVAWSWYLANDMQFYVISPLFLYALWRWPKIGLGIVFSLFCGSWIANFAISYHYDIFAGFTSLPTLANMASYLQNIQLYMDKLYVKPYNRIGPYLIGVLLGYIFSKTEGRQNFLTKTNQAIGWTVSTIMGFYIVFGLYHSSPTRVGNAFYNAFNRSCFSASLAWVIFACLTGHGGPVNKILSYSAFIPLGRLTYCAYLVHPIVLLVYFFSLPSTMIVTQFQMVMQYLGLLLTAYGIAFGTTLLLESPTMAIEKLFRFGSTAKRKDENKRT